MMNRTIIFFGVCLIASIEFAWAANGIIPFNRPGDERQDIMEKEPFEPKPQPELQLPDLPAPGDKSKQLSQQLNIKLSGIRFEGNTVFPDQQLSEMTAKYINVDIDTFALQQIRDTITRHYINNGYINSGAIIPDQDLENNILVVKIIEGNLTSVNVQNDGRLSKSYITERVSLPPNQPLNIGVLQEKLYLLQQNPRIKRINANLGPGVNRGDGILDMEITEEQPYNLALQFNNHRPVSVGEEQALINFQHLNLSGAGDTLITQFSGTEGLDEGIVSYRWPLGSNDSTIDFLIEKSQSEIIEESIKNAGIDIESESETASIGLTSPLFKSSSEEYTVTVSLDIRKSETSLNGTPISFTDSGANNGISRLTVLRATQSWLYSLRNSVYSFRHTMSIGLGTLNATSNNNPSIADGEFTAWLIQFQIAKQFANSQLQSIFRTDYQIAFDNLMPMEEFAIGGANTVRGYLENQLVRDNGFIASWELRQGIFRSESGQQIIQIIGFVDYGRAWSHEISNDEENISSFGAGLRWVWTNKAKAELYWADPQKEFDNTNEDSLQDEGIHINLVANIL